MKKIIKLFAISCLMLSSSVGAWCTVDGTLNTPAFECPVMNLFGFTTKQIDLCTDWSCTAPINIFTGSKYLEITPSGAVTGSDEISVNLPTSGTYSHIRLLFNNDVLMNGYGKKSNDWCATGSGTIYATEALAKAAATNTNFSFQLDKWLSWGNGVDASGYGDIIYGYGTGQNNIPGYTSHWSASELNEYTLLIRRDEGNDDFFLTTVLQGDYDFGSGKMPSTIVFGVTMDKVAALGVALADTDNSSPIDRGWTTLTDGSCVTYPAAFLFDYIIQ
jgi:hypothetical protein